MKVLVCFAVKEEAGPFRKLLGDQPEVETLVTGMGQQNAERAIRGALKSTTPHCVLTCGFAGGLRPGLKAGSVVFETEEAKTFTLDSSIRAAGGEPGRFVMSHTVMTTAAEKRAMWEKTRADAVEMESCAIRAICRDSGIPSATIRIVLDAAEEDLPLDFNKLMTPDKEMDFGKLALFLVTSPGKVPALLRLQKQSRAAAEKLAEVLRQLLIALRANSL